MPGRRYLFRYRAVSGQLCYESGEFLRTSAEYGVLWYWFRTVAGDVPFDYPFPSGLEELG